MKEITGVVVRGINNIYTVVPENQMMQLSTASSYFCRIKGKVLNGVRDSYNPLAVGDRVIASIHANQEGMIISKLPRHTSFDRWNAKRSMNQTLVANMDLVIIMSSVDAPPFRPRFIDRALVCAQHTPVLIVLNKCDLDFSEAEYERFCLYETLEYDIFAMSAFDDSGIKALRSRLMGKMVAVIGQSGVGKSTLVNNLVGGDIQQKTQEISQKYQRGRHTTNHALLLDAQGFTIVDTPGMRELLIPHLDVYEVADYFPEFRKYRGKCNFQPCLHLHEPDCAVKQAVESGAVHEDRYESYLRMIASIEMRPESWESERT